MVLKRGHCEVLRSKPGHQQVDTPARAKANFKGVDEEDSMQLCTLSPGQVRHPHG